MLILVELSRDISSWTSMTARAIGGESVGLRADVTSKESVEAMVKEVMDRFGRVDVLAKTV
jgi:2-hydroxycyclohexanecarboxyl-CoA dehydrogenase